MVETALITSGMSILEKAIQQGEKYLSLKKDKKTYLRLIYLEVLSNLEVFEAVDLKNINTETMKDGRLSQLLDLLQTDLLESIFYGGDDKQLYDLLAKKRGRIEEKENSLKYQHVLQAISFVVIKTNLLKKLNNTYSTENNFLKRIHIAQRLGYIKERLVMIKRKFGEFDEIKDMAR